MPIEIKMPKLTDTMTEATLAKWLKKEGDPVKPGDMLAEVETDKATQELELFDTGVVAKIVAGEGTKLAVGGLIAVLAKPGEDVKAIAAAVKTTASAPAPKATSASVENADGNKAAIGASAGSPGANTPVGMQGGTSTKVEDHHEGSEPEAIHTGKIRVSPLARKIADDKGVDLNTVRGTGPDGRIIRRDVLDAAGRPARQAPTTAGNGAKATPAAAPVAPAVLESKTIPLSNIRQVIARRLLESKQTIPHFYLSIDVEMDKLLDLRAQVNEQIAPTKLSVTDFIARATAVALAKNPAMNASFTGTAIQQHGSVELGIAVALDDGLLVPVIKAAHNKGVRAISAEIKQLAELARSKKLRADQMTGSTFTISNLGMYGVKNFSAIVNPPESAILAVGGTTWQPVVHTVADKKEIVPAQVMNLTLSVDHRAVDGATGAKFLQDLKSILEAPLGMLV